MSLRHLLIVYFIILIAELFWMNRWLKAEEPDQVARWKEAKVNPIRNIELDKAVALYQRTEPRYKAIERLRQNGVPSTVLFGLHYREADNSFRCSLAQGDPLIHRSRNVPRGRLPDVDPPYTWEICAEDAVYNVDRLDLKDWRHLQSALQAISNYNGSGYDRPGRPPTPYLWAATSIERPGKFVADGRYSPTARDQQLGVCAILKRMEQWGIKIPIVFFGAPDFRTTTKDVDLRSDRRE